MSGYEDNEEKGSVGDDQAEADGYSDADTKPTPPLAPAVDEELNLEDIPKLNIERRKTTHMMGPPLIERRKTEFKQGALTPEAMADLRKLGAEKADDQYDDADGLTPVQVPSSDAFARNSNTSGTTRSIRSVLSNASEYSANDPTPRGAPAANFGRFSESGRDTMRTCDYENADGTTSPAASAPPDMPSLEAVAMLTITRTTTDQFKHSYDVEQAIEDAKVPDAEDEYADADGASVATQQTAPADDGDNATGAFAMPKIARTKTDEYNETYDRPADLDAHFGAESPNTMATEDDDEEADAPGSGMLSLLKRQTTDKFKNSYDLSDALEGT